MVKTKQLLTAWMIRRDGEAFPCVQHIYGSTDCIEESLYAAEWLYRHTASSDTRQLVIDFVYTWGASLNKHRNAARNLLLEIPKRPYVFLTADFVREISGKMRMERSSVEELNCKVNKALNEEFLRCRYGGLYHTKAGNHDLYFRISSAAETPWIPVIDNFTKAFPSPLSTVTVLWDEESTGRSETITKKDIADSQECVTEESAQTDK